MLQKQRRKRNPAQTGRKRILREKRRPSETSQGVHLKEGRGRVADIAPRAEKEMGGKRQTEKLTREGVEVAARAKTRKERGNTNAAKPMTKGTGRVAKTERKRTKMLKRRRKRGKSERRAKARRDLKNLKVMERKKKNLGPMMVRNSVKLTENNAKSPEAEKESVTVMPSGSLDLGPGQEDVTREGHVTEGGINYRAAAVVTENQENLKAENGKEMERTERKRKRRIMKKARRAEGETEAETAERLKGETVAETPKGGTEAGKEAEKTKGETEAETTKGGTEAVRPKKEMEAETIEEERNVKRPEGGRKTKTPEGEKETLKSSPATNAEAKTGLTSMKTNRDDGEEPAARAVTRTVTAINGRKARGARALNPGKGIRTNPAAPGEKETITGIRKRTLAPVTVNNLSVLIYLLKGTVSSFLSYVCLPNL